jgi:hypothetical protein
VKGLAVILYLLGLSYGAASILLEALGVYWCKSRVEDAVQAAAQRVPGLKHPKGFEEVRTPALGGDVTSVKCNGHGLPLGRTVDDLTGVVLTVDELSGEDAPTLQDWLTPIAEQVGAELLVTDDAEGFKTIAEALGLEQQVCKSCQTKHRRVDHPPSSGHCPGYRSVFGSLGRHAGASLGGFGATQTIDSNSPA